MQTRHADITDAAAIAAVIEGCGLFSDEEATGFIGTLPDLLADDDHTWIVTEGRVEGAAYLSLDGMSRDVWNLWFIAALPAGRGRGGALLAAAADHAAAQGGRILLIETSGAAGFDAARRFYTDRGYAEAARIADYYAPGDDKVIFARSLG